MAQARPNAVYIGIEKVGEFLEKLRPDWDFLPHVPDITSLWEGLNDGTIDNNIQIILILDQFFDPEGEDTSFEKLVSTMAPHCFFGIINYRAALKEHMRERIGSEAYSTGDSSNLLYYFIDPKRPNQSLDVAVNGYVKDSPEKDVVSIITGRGATELTPVQEVEKATQAASPEAAAFSDFEDHDDTDYLGQLVSVTSSKGGSGKSTVAVSLATFLAHSSHNSVKEGLEERPLKILVLDLDVRDGQLGFLTGNSKPTVINLRLNGISPETISQTVIHSPRLKCDLMLAPKRPRNSEDTPPEFYVELITALRKMYDYIILDTSVNYLDPLLEKVAYPMSDQIVFVTDIVVNSVFSMTRWIQEVTKPKEQSGMGINRNKIGIVVNKSLSNVNMPGEKIARAAGGLPVITVIPSNPKLIAHAANMQSMEVLLKHKDLYPAIRRLAKGVAGQKYKLSMNVSA